MNFLWIMTLRVLLLLATGCAFVFSIVYIFELNISITFGKIVVMGLLVSMLTPIFDEE